MKDIAYTMAIAIAALLILTTIAILSINPYGDWQKPIDRYFDTNLSTLPELKH
jgi:hypothetical protein